MGHHCPYNLTLFHHNDCQNPNKINVTRTNPNKISHSKRDLILIRTNLKGLQIETISGKLDRTLIIPIKFVTD